jgi:hypothetical protein
MYGGFGCCFGFMAALWCRLWYKTLYWLTAASGWGTGDPI